MENQHGICTAKKMISHALLEKAFEEYIENIEDFTESDNANISKAEPKADHTVEIQTISAELKHIERKSEEIMGLFVSGNIDFDAYNGMIRINNQRRIELEARLNLLQNTEAVKRTQVSKGEIVANFKENWQTLNNDQRLKFIQKFVKKIVVRNEQQQGTVRGKIVFSEVVFNEF